MGFALLGVMAMQLYFLRQSYQMQSELFDRSVNEALNNVVVRISKHDALNFLNEKARLGNSYQAAWNTTTKVTRGKNTFDGNNTVITHPRKLSSRERKVALLRDRLKQMIIQKRMDDEMAGLNVQLRNEEFTDQFGEVHVRVTPVIVRSPVNTKLHKYDTIRYTYIDPQFGKQLISIPHINLQWQQAQDRKQKEKRLKRNKEAAGKRLAAKYAEQ